MTKSAWRQCELPPRQSLRFRRQRGGRREYDGSASRQFRCSMMFAPATWLRCRPFAGAAINAIEPPCPALVNHGRTGIDIRTKIVARDAKGSFRGQNILVRHSLRRLNHLPNCSLGAAQRLCQSLLGSSFAQASIQCFVGGRRCHGCDKYNQGCYCQQLKFTVGLFAGRQ